MKKTILFPCLLGLAVVSLAGCSDDEPTPGPKPQPGEENEVFSAAEWLPGGVLGTTDNASSSAYEDPTPAIEQAGLTEKFKYGEMLFERTFNPATPPFRGLGPSYTRSACIDCHPGYGHGKRVEEYKAEYGNGYLLVVYDKDTEAYVPELTGMPQTRAVSPFLPPVDEEGIDLKWLAYTDEYGNQFPDGETYSLIYPEVTIDPAYIHTDPKPTHYEVRLEATIGIYGTGLLDAIPDDSLLAQYQKEEAMGLPLNPAKYQNGQFVNLIQEVDGTAHPGRFTYALSRGTLQNGAGANAIWNITNVTRSDRPKLYTSAAWANAMANNTEIQQKLGVDRDSIYRMLDPTLPIHEAEMSDEDYINFMIWHRGLAVPAARNLHEEEVKKGKQLFAEAGCTVCHRPSWTTGEDKYSGDPLVAGKLPTYPHQTIWPYSDMVQHQLKMKNDIRTGWCRTTPLWGRGLSLLCTGACDRLHDMRARNEIEAIMWHGGDARQAKENFRRLSKEDRNAIVKFIQSI